MFIRSFILLPFKSCCIIYVDGKVASQATLFRVEVCILEDRWTWLEVHRICGMKKVTIFKHPRPGILLTSQQICHRDGLHESRVPHTPDRLVRSQSRLF